MFNPFKGITKRDFIFVGTAYCLALVYFITSHKNISTGLLFGFGYLVIIATIAFYIREASKKHKAKKIFGALLYGTFSFFMAFILFLPVLSEIDRISFEKEQIKRQENFSRALSIMREKLRKDIASGEWQKRQAELRKQYMKQHPGKDPHVPDKLEFDKQTADK